MNGSMEDFLKLVTPHLHLELVTPEAKSHLQALVKVLPLFSKAMLEFRLGAGQFQTDLSVFFSRRILHLPEKFLSHPVWQALQDFCWEYADPASSLYHCLRYIALEFDLDGQPSEIAIPCIF